MTPQTSRKSLYVTSIPYLAAFVCVKGVAESGLHLQGFIWSLFVIVGLFLMATKPGHVKITFPWKLWTPWFAYVAASFFWSSLQIRGNFQPCVQILAPLVVGLVASYAVTDHTQWNRFSRGFPHGLVFISFAFVYYWYGPPRQHQGISELSELGTGGTFFNARPTGMTLAIIGCVFLSNIREAKSRSLLGWAMCLLIALLSGSRMAVMVPLIIALISPLYRSLRTRLAGLLVICLLGVALFYTPIMQKRFFYSGQGRLSDIGQDDFADEGRFEFWDATVEEARRHIVVGAGVGEADLFIAKFFDISQVHNDYLRILFEFGVTGLLLFSCTAGLQILSLRTLMRANSKEANAAATTAFLGMIAWLCFSVTDNPLIYNVSFTHPLFAIIGAAYGMAARRTAPSLEAAQVIAAQPRRLWPAARRGLVLAP